MLDNLRLEASEDLEVNCWGGGAIFRRQTGAFLLGCGGWGWGCGVGLGRETLYREQSIDLIEKEKRR